VSWNRRDWVAIAWLALAPFALYWRLFVPGAARHYLESGDSVDQFYAFAHYEASSLAAGRIPLWNPFAFSGTPFWADVQAAVAYPPSLAAVLASVMAFGRLPFAVLEAEAVAHLVLAGALTYLFARRVIGCRPAALVAATAFCLGGYLTGYPVLQLAVLESNTWLPLALLGAALVAVGRSWKGAAALALGTGLGILAGHPQSALYLVLLTIAYAVWRLWPRALAGPGWTRAARHSARRWLLVAGGLALGAGLAAAGWLPALQYMRLSNRAAIDYAAVAHGFPPRELVGVLVAGITKWSPLYVGLLPLLLASAAVVRSFGLADAGDDRANAGDDRADTGDGGADAGDGGADALFVVAASDLAREGRFWSATAAVALVLSLGGRAFLFDLFYLLVPGFHLFRGQERSAFVFSFGLAMLAGIGFAAWLRCADDRGRCAVDRVVGGGALAATAVGLAAALLARPDMQTLGVRLAVLGVATLALAGARGAGLLSKRALTVAAIALVAADLYAVGSTTNLQHEAPGELTASPIVAALQDESSSRHVRVQNLDRLPRNFGVLHEVGSTYGASPMRPQAYETLRDGLADVQPSRWHDVAAATHVLAAPEASVEFDTTGRLAGEEGVLYELAPHRPLVWLVPCAEAVPDVDTALARLRDPDLDPYLVAVVQLETGGAPDGASSSDDAARCADASAGYEGRVGPGDLSVEAATSLPGLIEASTSSASPGWLVVAEGYYPGWQAEVDGRAADLLRANGAFMAVPVPAGEHHVQLLFTAPTVTLGLVISLLSAATLVAMALVLWRRQPASIHP